MSVDLHTVAHQMSAQSLPSCCCYVYVIIVTRPQIDISGLFTYRGDLPITLEGSVDRFDLRCVVLGYRHQLLNAWH